MSKRIRLALVLTAIFIVAALFLGTAAPQQTNSTVKSPYVSALSNYSVGTAVAANQHCNSGCLVLQGIQSCRTGESPGTTCTIVNGACSLSTCGH
jgi:hypothetical protein